MKSYILRTCREDMTSRNGFTWPRKGPVSCDDWDPEPKCGNGLHGLLMGQGDGSVLDWSSDAIWQVVEVDDSSMVNIGDGKVKFPCGIVVHTGDQKSATDFVIAQGADAEKVVGAFRQCGDRSTLVGGYQSSLVGGSYSTLEGGSYSSLVGGDNSDLAGGTRSTLTGGDRSSLTGGDYSRLMGGDRSELTGGAGSNLVGGSYSRLTGGTYSTMTCKWWDGNRYRIITAYVGEDGIDSGVPYRVEKGKFVRVEEETI